MDKRALEQLANFAGQQLAFVNYNLIRDGEISPFGLTLTTSFLSGATLNVTELRTDDPSYIQEMTERWFMTVHPKAKFVGVALDVFAHIDGIKQDAAVIAVRSAESPSRLLVYQPYTPRTEHEPLRLGSPRVDVPREQPELLPHLDLALANVIKGRDNSPLSKART